MTSLNVLINEYNRELGRCMLQSIDNGPAQPFISNEYLRLRDEMEKTGVVRKSKLDDDRAKIIAAATRSTWVNEFGHKYPAPTRDMVVKGLRQADMIKANLDQFNAALSVRTRD
jgi:hypothetical protein